MKSVLAPAIVLVATLAAKRATPQPKPGENAIRTMARGVMRALAITIFISFLLGLVFSSTNAAHAQAPPSPLKAAGLPTALAQSLQPAPYGSVRAWHTYFMQKAVAPEGCSKAAYPDTGWTQIPCAGPPLDPYQPNPQTVGNGTGYFARVAGSLTLAVGSFQIGGDGVSVTSEAGFVNGNPPLIANTFSLQLNTNAFPTPACKSAVTPQLCVGWQQFVYSSTGQLFMQYWLANFGPNCPKFWSQTKQVPNACFISSTSAPAPSETIGALASLSLEAVAGPVTDTVFLHTENEVYSASFTDAALSLANNWNQVEFNIYGDGFGTQANFNSGSIIDVGVILAYGTNNAPICATSSSAVTAETNSLTLLQPCYQLSGASNWGVLPGIEFTESNLPTPTVLSVTPTTGPVTGNVAITISGTNFTNVSSVLIGTLPATSFSVNSVSSIAAVVPAFAGGQISVTTPNGVAVGAGYFPYPIITSVSPASGPIRGGIGVTVSGIGMPNSWATPFSFGGVTVAASCGQTAGQTAGQCVMTSPPAPLGQAGSVDITIGGSLPIAADRFTYTGPTITAVQPNRGSTAGGTSVLVEGNGFTSNMTVTFFGNPATPIGTTCQLGAVVNTPGSDSCSFFSPPGTGTVPVVANVNGSDSPNTPAALFTYVERPREHCRRTLGQ